MDEYQHHVSGFFARREDAESSLSKLVGRGLPRERLRIFEGDSAAAAATPAPKGGSNEALKDMLVDGAIGTAVGTGVGALGELALVAANVSLFVASPLIAPLVMLGWGASLGGLIGAMSGAEKSAAVTGAKKKEGPFSALVRDAISSGQIVLVAETRTVQETSIAREVIQAAVGACTDVSLV
ncbi:MAG TPA: hypothetical protein VF319_12705 [Caldimonas sp.]